MNVLRILWEMIMKNQAPIPLSVAIITKNEEERLSDCLKSVHFAQEVLVVDDNSTDRTREIAKSFGARVLIEPWRGFSGQKQYAVDQCANDWVLILDADERIPQETAAAIHLAMNDENQNITAYSFKRKNFLHGRWIRHCGWWPDPVVRLVDRTSGAFDGRPVHERWLTEGSIQAFDVAIEHLSFRNYSELVEKMERYSNLGASELCHKKNHSHALTPISHGCWMFLRTFILELGALDGFDGFVISIMNAGGSFFKYAKFREMKKYGRY